MKVATAFAGLALAAAAAACGSTRAAGDEPARAAADATPPGVVLLDERQLVNVKVDAVTERDLPRTLTVAGKVQFDEDRLARILAPLPGQIVDLHVKVGDAVRKGQPVCAINSRDVAAAISEHAESHKDLELAQKTLAMTADLFEHQAASKIALQQAQNDHAKASARVARADQELRILGLADESAIANFNGRLRLPSPLNGVVIERRVTDGQFVQTDGNPLVVVADLSAVWVVGDLFERDLRLVTIGRQAAITAAAYPGEQFSGRVNYVSDTIDPATRTAKVRVSVANPGSRLKPEMFATVTLGLADTERVVTVPARAVFSEDGRTFVYAAVGNARFARRPVQLGPEEGDDRRVLGGLAVGDRIVTDGALLIRQEEEKRAG